MIVQNSQRIMELLEATDLVLDIGGWGHPFNRANYVLDLEPYETRGYYNRTFARNNPIPPIGGAVEHFRRETWIQRDICDRTPYPFADKQFDFVTCSHTLEDVRDPLWVCAEMIRIGKAGYIEVPSRVWESCRGMERGIAGLSHHRWLIGIAGNSLRFLSKLHRIHNWRYSLPKSVLRGLSETQSVQWLFWQDSFEYSEVVLHGDAQLQELDSFVQRIRPHPRALLAADDCLQSVRSLFYRAGNKLRRTFA
jgi:Methyltransferase domain